ncbi:Lactotransferrin [Pteropus alecto]|uniref:Lactotransferrin n=1 Tax=Pteropus alecto TaxID=9402 RepID=L5KI15_PTEAL|nr:Lactotransferrin [Pteropus alecto]
MSNLQWLDISNNNLNDLPQDIDRLEELQTFLLYKNKLTYLPYELLNLKKLSLLVVSGDRLVELPTALCDSSTPLKFVSLMDNPIENTKCQDGDKMMESEQDRQHFDKEFMKAYIEDLKERGLCLAASKRGLRWCNVSKAEAAKCSKLRRNLRKVNGPLISCSRKASHKDCIQAIAENKADAVALDSRLLFEAVMEPYNLRPVAAEFYGTEESEFSLRTQCWGGRGLDPGLYGVRVDESQSWGLLQGVESLGSLGQRLIHWVRTLYALWTIRHKGPCPTTGFVKPETHFYAVAVVKKASSFLRNQVKGVKSCHSAFNSSVGWDIPIGTLRPLLNWAGPSEPLQKETLQDRAERDQYELLCLDNTRKPVDEFKDCYLAQVPFHTIVARRVNGNENEIWEFLNQAQENFGNGKDPMFQLFDSPSEEKDLLFKDGSKGFLRIPPTMDAGLYLGSNYLKAVRGLTETVEEVESLRTRVLWCAVGPKEESKCQQWSAQSNGKVTCATANTTEDCITLVLKGEADAMSLDGGFIYIAGKCGLVPVLAESQKSEKSRNSDCVNRPVEGYYAVAVVRKSNADLTWNSLKNKKSCHTAVGRTAGWNIPMGLLFKQTGSCKFGEFFSQSCAPGSDPSSSLCALCIGNDLGQDKCASNSNERYFGYNGAFRCLAENAGDVAFVKDTTVLDNTNGKSTEAWAKDLKVEDFELLCLDGSRKPVTEAERCHLAVSPNHGVVSRKDKVEHLEQVLLEQQSLCLKLVVTVFASCYGASQSLNEDNRGL